MRVSASSVNPIDNSIAAGMLAQMGIEYEYPVTLGRDYGCRASWHGGHSILEADDIPSAMQAMATFDDPFDQRFRELSNEVHGIDLPTVGLPPSTCTKRASEAPPAAARFA